LGLCSADRCCVNFRIWVCLSRSTPRLCCKDSRRHEQEPLGGHPTVLLCLCSSRSFS
jgi:hypothetical protein